MPVGFFITFEGLDGAGKSTQLRLLKECLEREGRPVTVTRQPGGTRIGDGIRSLLLSSRTEGLSPLTELALMFSDRAQSIAEIIQPALDRGRIVLCDRFTDSTEAYQGGGRKLGSRIVLDLHSILCGSLTPDLTFLLLSGARTSLERARRRNLRAATSFADENRFENEAGDFHLRVLQKYLEIASRESARVVPIQGGRSIEEIHETILQTVQARLSPAALPSTGADGESPGKAIEKSGQLPAKL